MNKKYLFLILHLILILYSQLYSQNIELKATLSDLKTKKAIPFANIGIFHKNIGTVSDQNGNFSIKIPKKYAEDSLKISHISYETIKVAINEIKKDTIFLKSSEKQLEEIFISNKKIKRKKIGVKTHNPLLWAASISKKNDILETAQKISLKNIEKAKIISVRVFIRKGFEPKKYDLRVNFYEDKFGKPGDKIIYKNVIENINIMPGWLKIDLSDYNITLKQDFFISVELLPNFKSQKEIYFGGILSKGKGFYRKNSHGKWINASGAYSINVEINY